MNIISFNNFGNNHSTTNVSPMFTLPHELFQLICRYLGTAENFVHFASTNHRLYFLIKDASLWNLFLRRDFPNSCLELKSEAESLSFYKRLTVMKRNIKAGKYHLQVLNGHEYGVNNLVICNDKLISSSYDGVIKVWDIKDGKELGSLLEPHTDWISNIVVYDSKIISSSMDGTIKIWDLKNGQVKTLYGHEDEVHYITVSDGKLLSGSNDNTIKIWDIETGKELRTLKGHQGGSHIVVYEGKIISGSNDNNTIKIWDIETGEELQTLKGHQDSISHILVDEDKIISSSLDATIKIWDLKTGQVQTLSGGRHINCIAVYGDKLISTSTMTIKIWDLKSGKQLQTLDGHEGTINSLVACDGVLFSGSRDGMIKIWDFESGKELLMLNGHRGELNSIIFDNKKLISCADDKTIKIWDFNLPYERTLKENKNQSDSDFKITDEEYSQKLKCPPDHLPKIGICSSADLQALGLFKNSFHFDYLKGVSEEAIESCDQPQNICLDKESQDMAFDKKEIVFSLLTNLLDAAVQMANEAEHGALFHGTGNIWIAFQKELNHYKAALDSQCQTPRELMNMFNHTKSYKKIAEQMNLFIDKFQRLNHEHQIAILSAYVNQFGIYKVWIERYKPLRIESLAALLEQKDMAPLDPFRMGI